MLMLFPAMLMVVPPTPAAVIANGTGGYRWTKGVRADTAAAFSALPPLCDGWTRH